MRTQFDQQLEQLHIELIQMGGLCEEAISLSAKAFLDDDAALLPKVFATDSKIDQKERDIESLCLKLLLQQQPVARDLRTVSSALRMIADMERIGDQASDIAEITRYTVVHPGKNKSQIREMAVATIKMVTESIDSFVRLDLALAQSVMAYDDVVDRLFSQIKTQLIALLADGYDSEYCIDLLMIAKYLERIGDHATNIAEWVAFAITGQHPKN